MLVLTVNSPRAFCRSKGLPCVPSARSCSWRRVNGLDASSDECYHDDENDENAKRDQFYCKHTCLPQMQTCANAPDGSYLLTEGTRECRRAIAARVAAQGAGQRFA